MKKFLSLLLSLLLCIFILPLSGCGSDSDMYIPEDSSKILKISPDRLNVDWDLAVSNALLDDSVFSYGVDHTDIFIDGTSITFDIAVSPDSPHYYMDSVCSLMRALNEAAMLQDKRIPSYGEFSLGGIYDVFETTVVAYSPDNEANSDCWFINDTLAPGEHRKRLPRPLDGSPAVPLNIVCSQLEGIFLTDHYPVLKHLIAYSIFPSSSFENIPDIVEVCIMMEFNENIQPKELATYSRTAIHTLDCLAANWDSRMKSSNENLGLFSEYLAIEFLSGTDKYYIHEFSFPGKPLMLEVKTDE